MSQSESHQSSSQKNDGRAPLRAIDSLTWDIEMVLHAHSGVKFSTMNEFHDWVVGNEQ